jgi:phosphopantetheinyl transferase
MDKGVQIWAVDISAYDLWDNESKGDNLICMLLGSAQEEQTKVKRYVREIDQIRSLAGKLLVRLAIFTLRKDLKWDKLLFQITSQGRPFLSAPVLDFDYNITHDGDWVSIAFRGSCQDQEEVTPSVIGVDVMEMHLPHYEKSIEDFVDTLDISFTPREQQWVLAKDTDEEEPALSDTARQLKRLYTV